MVNRWKGSRYRDNKGGGLEANQVMHPKIELKYIHPSYQLEEFDENTITEQGLLLVGKIIPKQSGLPEFLVRWDEKDSHLNIDMKPEAKHWRRETHGYRGHTPSKVNDSSGRVFLLVIAVPEVGEIVNGTISFGLGRNATFKTGLSIKTSFDIEFRKGHPESEQE
jgi:hypothetical protein